MANNNPKVLADAEWYVGEGVTDSVAQMLAASGLGYGFLRKTVAFDGTAGVGAVGKVALFTVTGAVAYRLIAICTESLDTGAGATISVGVAGGAVDGIIAVTTGVDLDAGEIWFDATPTTKQDTLANSMIEQVIGDGADIEADILVDAVTDGTIAFNLFWTPLSTGATVVAA